MKTTILFYKTNQLKNVKYAILISKMTSYPNMNNASNSSPGLIIVPFSPIICVSTVRNPFLYAI